MSELAGVDGEVPIKPKVDANEAAIRSRVKQIAEGAKSEAEIEVTLDDRLAKREFDRTKRAMERNNKVHMEVEADLKKLTDGVEDARHDIRELEGEFKNLNNVDLKRLETAQKNLVETQKEYESALGNSEKAAQELARAQVEVNEAGDNPPEKLLKNLKAKQKAFRDTQTSVNSLRDDLQKYYEESVSAQATLDENEKNYYKNIDEANDLLNDRTEIFKEHEKQARERLTLEDQLHTIQTGSLREVRTLLEQNRQAGEDYHGTLKRILSTAEELGDVDFSHLEQMAQRGFGRDGVARLRVEADTAMAEAELQWLERDRVVRITARIDHALTGFLNNLTRGGKVDRDIMHITNKYTSMATGLAKAIGGFGNIGRMTDGLVYGARNMDALANSAARLTLILGPLAGSLVSFVGLSSSVGKSLVTLAKGAAILPALGVAAGAMFFGLKEGFSLLKDGFSSAGDTIRNEAPEMADAMRDIGDAFQEAAQRGNQKFFAEVSDDIVKLRDAIGPITGLYEDSLQAAGKFYAGAARGVTEWFDSGDMGASLGLMGDAMKIAANAAKPLTSSLLDFVSVGSNYLPGLADQFVDLTEKFASFTREAKDNGDIARWIEEAGQQMVYLGGVVKGATGMLGALGKAADQAGFGGLRSLSEGLQIASDKMNSPLWQGGMANLFKGALDGARNAAEGFGILGDSVMLTSGKFERMSGTLGQAVGDIAGHIGKMMTHSKLLEGTSKFVDDIGIAAERSGPLVRYMGDAFGQSAEVAGELVKAAQRISEAFFRVWGDARGLTDGLVAVIPPLTDIAVAGLDVAHVFTTGLANVIGGILTAFAGLPGPVQRAVVSLGLLTLALTKIRGMGGIGAVLAAQFPAIASGAERAQRSVRNFGAAWALGRDEMRRAGGVYRTAAGELQSLGSRAASASASVSRAGGGFREMGRNIGAIVKPSQSAVGAMSGLGRGASEAAKGIGGAAGHGLLGAGKSLVGFLGGPWGVALIGAGVAVSIWANEVAQAQKRVENIKGSLDEFGNTTANTTKAIKENFDSLSSSNMERTWTQMFDFSTRFFDKNAEGFGTLKEQIEGTGRSMSEVADLTAEGGEGFRDYQSKVYQAADSAGRFGTLSKEMSLQLFGTTEAAGMTRSELVNLGDSIGEQFDITQQAIQGQRELADSLGTSSFEAKVVTDSMATMKDEMATSADKASAFKSAMDVMSGGVRSQREAFLGSQEAISQVGDSYKKVAEAVGQGVPVFEDFKLANGNTITQLNSTSQATRELEGNLRSSYDATLEYAMTVYDSVLRSGGSMGEASNKAMEVMNNWSNDARDGLTNVSGDAQKAGEVIESITGKPYMAEVTFMGKTEEFMKAQQMVTAKGEEFNGEAFTAFLKANPDAASSDIEALIDQGINWSSAVYSAELNADEGQARSQIDEIVSRGREWDSSEYDAMLKGDNSGFLDAVIAATSDGRSFTDSEYMAELTGDSGAFDYMVADAKAQGEEFGSSEWVARMDIENPGFAEKLYAAEAGLKGLTGEDYYAYVRDNMEEVNQHQQDLSSGLGALNGTVAEVNVKTNAAAQAVVLEAFRMKAQGMSNEEIQMRLGLDSSEFDTIMEGIPGKWQTNKDAIEAAEAHLKANPDDVDGAIEAAKQKGLTFNEEVYEAKLGIDDSELQGGLDKGKTTLGQFEQERAEGKLGANNDEVNTKVEQSKVSISGMDVVSGMASIDASDQASPKASFAQRAIGFINGLMGIGGLDATDNASPKANSASGLIGMFNGLFGLAGIDANDQATGKVQGAKGEVSTWDGQTYSSLLDAQVGDVTARVASALMMIRGWTAVPFYATLSAKAEQLGGVVAGAKATVMSFASTRATAVLAATASTVGGVVSGARGLVSGFGAVRAVATLAANSGPVGAAIAGARGMGMGFAASVFRSTLSGNSGPFSGVVSGARGIGQGFAASIFLSTLNGNSGPFQGVVSAALGVGRGFAGNIFQSTLNGNSGPFSGVVSSALTSGRSFAAQTFSATFTATATGVSNALSAAMSAGRSWAGRVFTAIFNAKKNNADGGFYTKAFANGGFARNVQRFASGGTRKENHRAMIANASTVHRVWAEPETGGEAYIPLASSKRDRSTEILGQVAKHFGLTVNKYAEGGVEYVGGVEPSVGPNIDSTGSNQEFDFDGFGATVEEAVKNGLSGWNIQVTENSRGFAARMNRANQFTGSRA